MAAPIFMNMEQVPEGPYQQMFAPQMVPCCFVATPEFCEGMYVPPLGGYEAAWPQGVNRFPSQKRQGHQKRNYGAPRLPRTFPLNSRMWSQQDSGSQEPVTVELSCLPKMLCNKACLEASIEQAGFEKDVQSLEIKAGDAGEATLILANERAAQRCVQHFDGLQWAKSAQPVSARYFLQQSEPQPPQQQEAQSTFEKQTPKDLPSTPVTLTPKSTPKLSPKSSFSGSPSMKPRWADLDSDDDDEDLISKSTRTGTWDSGDLFTPQASSDSGEASNSEQEL